MTDRAPPRLAGIEAFKDLPGELLAQLEARLRMVSLARGDTLIRQGEEADALFIVASGRLDVTIAGREKPVAHIGPGRPVGEIAFFAGGRRTATVTAARDSLVLELTREDFDSLAQSSPGIWSLITADLARRLADTNPGGRFPDTAAPRTIAIISGGSRPVAPQWVDAIVSALERAGARVRRLDSGTIATPLDARETTRMLNAIESEVDHLVYVGDATLTAWSEKAIRQADLVLAVGDAAAADAEVAPNPLERFASGLHAAADLTLVLVHTTSATSVTGTARWLEARASLGMHHHVATGRIADFDRLARFVRGQALGLVLCGGGAYTAAHIGVHQALVDAGFVIDMVGGTSGGSAMAAAFALEARHDEIAQRSHEMFVTRRVMRRWTVPRYSLIDHTLFDAQLARHFTDVAIEDLWLPFFAVSTNLTDNCLMVHRRGPLWAAIRASSAIPALLPPVFTADGTTLVDGALMDNVPVGTMHALKRGPNIVVHFELPSLPRCTVDHRTLPSRGRLLLQSLTRAGRARLPPAPSPQAVLLHGLTLPRSTLSDVLRPEDVLFAMTPPDGITHLDWHEQARLRQAGYTFARAQIDAMRRADHPLFRGAGD